MGLGGGKGPARDAAGERIATLGNFTTAVNFTPHEVANRDGVWGVCRAVSCCFTITVSRH